MRHWLAAATALAVLVVGVLLLHGEPAVRCDAARCAPVLTALEVPGQQPCSVSESCGGGAALAFGALLAVLAPAVLVRPPAHAGGRRRAVALLARPLAVPGGLFRPPRVGR